MDKLSHQLDSANKTPMRLSFLFILLVCIGLLSYAQYLQHVKGLLPCPLCVAQRLAYWSLALTAFVALLHNPKSFGRHLYSLLIVIFAFIGTIIAARHAWLIRYPESFECGISPEEALLNSLPIANWWPGMFEANGDCANVYWTFLSLTIPDWSLSVFVGLGILALYPLLTRR
ncbi:disulfide bond formation protein B [Nitrosomonas ureae]|uniref:Disulfide bond formation protein B n=1 Tax=Nitrosomonas ureae TaxID=44577 RepID=A0A286A332_9PROT|nr:disulfide bond formation protein B [Nitrosomonas ureae]SOD16315.1 Thiol:disulfide interchange protein DsbB [Nitrosomonas ureae]